MPLVKRTLPWVVGGLCIILAAVGALGLLHTAPGRALWSQATGQECPFGFKGLSLQQQNASHQALAARRKKGVDQARETPALGFVLQQTSRSEFLDWAKKRGIPCTAPEKKLSVECRDVPLADMNVINLKARGSLIATFDLDQHLNELVLVARTHNAVEAMDSLRATTQHLTSQAGPPDVDVGEDSAQYLAAVPLTQANREFHFSNYYAQVNVTNMGALGYFAITHTYQAL